MEPVEPVDQDHLGRCRGQRESEVVMKLRPYPAEAKHAVFDKLAHAQSTLVEMATGLGKTVLAGHICHEWPGRVLWIAHRDELIRQAADAILRITGDMVAVEMGRERADWFGAKVTVGSVQTLCRAQRRERFDSAHFSLVVIDEGHHGTSVTYREVLEYFSTAKRLFITATPKRAHDVALEHVCETVAYQYGIEPAIDDGWLVPVKQTVVKVEGLDFSKARTVAEDFNTVDLERILTEEKPLHAMVASAHKIIGDRQALWFCVTVSHAKMTANILSRYAPADQVQFLSGNTPIEERRYVVDQYKKGDIQHLCNCALFLEGFDAPQTSAIVMGRPTKSIGLYTQVLGRGTRPLPGIVDGIETAEARKTSIAMSAKPGMVVIDFAGNAGKHKIVQASDVLGGKYEPPVREYAKNTLAEEGDEERVDRAMARAKAEMDLEVEESKRRINEAMARALALREAEKLEAKRRRAIKAEVSFQTHDIDPFVRQYRPNGKPVGELCSRRQASYICYLADQVGESWTMDKASQLTRRQVQGVIAELKKRGAR